MAARRKRKFPCDLCDMEFDYESKYQRHLESARFASIQAPISDPDHPSPAMTDADDQDPQNYQVATFQSPYPPSLTASLLF